MDFKARLDLLHNSKQVKKLEELQSHLGPLSKQLELERDKLGEAEDLVYSEEENCLESQMMVCVRTRSDDELCDCLN